MQKKNNHWYVLPSGQIVENQLEGRKTLGIGRNAFRNKIKSGEIKKIMTNNRPQGYEKETRNTD